MLQQDVVCVRTALVSAISVLVSAECSNECRVL